ncbi:MAG: AMIN-like domain-containing (lipo)protein [Nocardioides sp.]
MAPGGVFEGEQQAFIGLTGVERPFRVRALADPVRVVVDVRHG